MKTVAKNLVFSQAEIAVRDEINDGLKKILGKSFSQKSIIIDYPPMRVSGDYSVPCFFLGKILKQSPNETAKNLAAKFKPNKLIAQAEAAGPYLNFFVKKEIFNQSVLTEIFKTKDKFGKNKIGRGKKVMVEYFSPNTNKPLTVGHLRNICLGVSLVELLKFCGYKVITGTLFNDRGIAIAKTILGYQKWGKNQTPKDAKMKPDHFVGSFYVKFCQEAKNNPKLEDEAKLVLQKWEKNDKEILAVWQKLTGWVISGFKETLKQVGVGNFDEEYYESAFYHAGKEIVESGLKSGVFVKNQEGVVLAPLQNFGLPDKIVLRPDDTTLYVTQDLYLARLKDRYHLDRSIYVVGSEQDLYFKQLFKILELLGVKNSANYYHLSYGMIRLPSGKIKSREGLAPGTSADQLFDDLIGLAASEVKKREKDLSVAEIAKRASAIALGALKFYILTVDAKTTMVFEPQKSVALLGRTGPYLQYVIARINSIFAKQNNKPSGRVDFSALTGETELALIKMLARFPLISAQAAENYQPSLLANFLYDLAKAFSSFYEHAPVLKAGVETKKARLLLIYDVKIVLNLGLALLGIPILEKM